jgi:hypothetical protein
LQKKKDFFRDFFLSLVRKEVGGEKKNKQLSRPSFDLQKQKAKARSVFWGFSESPFNCEFFFL